MMLMNGSVRTDRIDLLITLMTDQLTLTSQSKVKTVEVFIQLAADQSNRRLK